MAKTFARTCQACGTKFRTPSAEATFCAPACRAEFNNRRRLRGAELYDLFMATRFDRPAARDLKLWRAMCRMASGFRDEDHQTRDGRQSWRDPRAVLEQRVYLSRVTTAEAQARARRKRAAGQVAGQAPATQAREP